MKESSFDEQDSGENPPSHDGSVVRGTSVNTHRRKVNWLFFTAIAGTAVGFALLKRGPASVSAANQPAANTIALDQVMTSELPRIRSVDQAMSKVDTMVADITFSPATVQVPLMELKGNPFRLLISPDKASQTQDESNADDLREQERQAALKAVQSLQLQSILRGTQKRSCIINNARYLEGQDAGGFLVEEITPNTVVVRKGVYRFELKLSM